MAEPGALALASDTATRVLETAERLTQTRGFNGFSYADIAAKLGITKASLHYHFPSKAELGRSLVVRYTSRFHTALKALEDILDFRNQLRGYVRLYEDVLVRDRMCLCGMLAAEYTTLPPSMQREVRRFFKRNESWLARCLQGGREQGKLHYQGSARQAARSLMAGLEGAMLMARSFGEPARFRAVAKRLLVEVAISAHRRAEKSRP